MPPTRRSFLLQTATVALATSTSMGALAQRRLQELTTSERIGLDTMAADPAETFSKWVGGAFRITLRRAHMGTIQLARVETTYYPPRKPSTNAQVPGPATPEPVNPFEITSVMLHFKRTALRIEQEVYTLDHDWLGTFDLLLVPCAPHKGSTTCTAVITRFPGQTPYQL